MQLGGKGGCKHCRALTEAEETNRTLGMTPVHPQTERQLQNVASSPREQSLESDKFVTATRPFFIFSITIFISSMPEQTLKKAQKTTYYICISYYIYIQNILHFQGSFASSEEILHVSDSGSQVDLSMAHIPAYIREHVDGLPQSYKSLATLNCSSGPAQRAPSPRHVTVTTCSGCRQGYSVDTHRKKSTQP